MVHIRDGLEPNPLDQNIPRLWGSLALNSVLKFSTGFFQQGTKSSEHRFGKFGCRSVLCSCSCSPRWAPWAQSRGTRRARSSPSSSPIRGTQVKGIVTLGLCRGGDLRSKRCMEGTDRVQGISPHRRATYPKSANTRVYWYFSLWIQCEMGWASTVEELGLYPWQANPFSHFHLICFLLFYESRPCCAIEGWGSEGAAGQIY